MLPILHFRIFSQYHFGWVYLFIHFCLITFDRQIEDILPAFPRRISQCGQCSLIWRAGSYNFTYGEQEMWAIPAGCLHQLLVCGRNRSCRGSQLCFVLLLIEHLLCSASMEEYSVVISRLPRSIAAQYNEEKVCSV